MRITVHRPTPGLEGRGLRSPYRPLWEMLPFDIDVVEVPRTDYPGKCVCKTIFQITDDGVSWLRKLGLIREELAKQMVHGAGNPCVCRCMTNAS